jgi:hypothetical protein
VPTPPGGTTPAAPPGSTTPAAPPGSTTPGGAPASPAPTPIAGDEIYCTTARRFTTDESTPPVISLLTTKLRGGTRAGVQMSLSKVSNVGMTIRQGAKVVWRNSATVEGGRPRLLWLTPERRGTFTVTLSATDPAGNFATANGTIAVEGHP